MDCRRAEMEASFRKREQQLLERETRANELALQTAGKENNNPTLLSQQFDELANKERQISDRETKLKELEAQVTQWLSAKQAQWNETEQNADAKQTNNQARLERLEGQMRDVKQAAAARDQMEREAKAMAQQLDERTKQLAEARADGERRLAEAVAFAERSFADQREELRREHAARLQKLKRKWRAERQRTFVSMAHEVQDKLWTAIEQGFRDICANQIK